MEASDYAVVLRERLGNDGYDALEEMMRVSRENLLTVPHFERRLTEELTTVRLAVAQSEAALRLEIREGLAAVRQEMAQGDGFLRQEIVQLGAALRVEMRDGDAALRQEMGTLRQEMTQGDASLRLEIAGLRQDILAGRFELVKWSFVFWVGQAFTVAAIVGVMLRLTRP